MFPKTLNSLSTESFIARLQIVGCMRAADNAGCGAGIDFDVALARGIKGAEDKGVLPTEANNCPALQIRGNVDQLAAQASSQGLICSVQEEEAMFNDFAMCVSRKGRGMSQSQQMGFLMNPCAALNWIHSNCPASDFFPRYDSQYCKDRLRWSVLSYTRVFIKQKYIQLTSERSRHHLEVQNLYLIPFILLIVSQQYHLKIHLQITMAKYSSLPPFNCKTNGERNCFRCYSRNSRAYQGHQQLFSSLLLELMAVVQKEMGLLRGNQLTVANCQYLQNVLDVQDPVRVNIPSYNNLKRL